MVSLQDVMVPMECRYGRVSTLYRHSINIMSIMYSHVTDTLSTSYRTLDWHYIDTESTTHWHSINNIPILYRHYTIWYYNFKILITLFSDVHLIWSFEIYFASFWGLSSDRASTPKLYLWRHTITPPSSISCQYSPTTSDRYQKSRE